MKSGSKHVIDLVADPDTSVRLSLAMTALSCFSFSARNVSRVASAAAVAIGSSLSRALALEASAEIAM
jgi:hypothetical protein